MKTCISAAGRVSLALLLSAAAAAGQPGARIRINEVMFYPAGSGTLDEFIEIVNCGSESADLTGWTISDDNETGNTITALSGGTVLLPGQYALIFTRAYYETSHYYAHLIPADALLLVPESGSMARRGLSNSRSETVYLKDGGGRLIDTCAYSPGNNPGYSDERVHPDRHLWLDGCTFNGTPGSRNSIYASQLPGRAEVHVQPEVFRAGGSEIESGTVISWKLPLLRANLLIKIFSIRGVCVRTLKDGGYAGSSGETLWDGRDGHGRAVYPGLYIILLEAVEGGSGKACHARCTVTVRTG